MTTRGADQSVANRIEGIDKNPDFASSIREGGRFSSTDNPLVQPRVTSESEAPHKTIRIEALDKNVELASL